MSLLLLLIVGLDSYFNWRLKLADYKFTASSYYAFIYPFYRLAQPFLNWFLKQPFANPYLRWHRLLYSNSQLDLALLQTTGKVFCLCSFGLTVIIDSFIMHLETLIYLPLLGIVLLLPSLPIIKLKRAYQQRCQQIMRELPAFIQQMALLIKAGSNARQSVDIIYHNCQRQEGLQTLLGHVYFEHERGNDFFRSFSILNEFIHHKAIHHLSLLLGQVKRAGVHQFSRQLVELADLMLIERQTYIRMLAEQLSTKLLAPMMISMVTILLLLLYPIIVQLH